MNPRQISEQYGFSGTRHIDRPESLWLPRRFSQGYGFSGTARGSFGFSGTPFSAFRDFRNHYRGFGNHFRVIRNEKTGYQEPKLLGFQEPGIRGFGNRGDKKEHEIPPQFGIPLSPNTRAILTEP